MSVSFAVLNVIIVRVRRTVKRAVETVDRVAVIVGRFSKWPSCAYSSRISVGVSTSKRAAPASTTLGPAAWAAWAAWAADGATTARVAAIRAALTRIAINARHQRPHTCAIAS